MKFDIKNPAFLQAAGRSGKGTSLFYITSLANGNSISFADNALGFFADNVQFSTDLQTWEQLREETVITLGLNETVYFRNQTKQVYNFESPYSLFRTSNKHKVGGDIINLLFPNAPLPINALASAFEDNADLQDASALQLPTTSLAEGCYQGMFSGCAGLTVAPELPATSLVKNCYSHMFYGCTSLTAVTCLATDIQAEGCINDWLKNVSETGVFTKSADMEDWPEGASGIPTGWTVQDYVG